MGQPVSHLEIVGDDFEGLTKFYMDAFDWQHDQENSVENYNMVGTGHEGPTVGIGSPAEGMGNYATVYILVPDITAHLGKIEAAGGKTIVPRTELPMVTFAMFADPAGNTIGLVEGGSGS